jgi:two-component system, chemotaxis family, sensor kinase Cph1
LLLKRENADLRQFAATAAHDLKAPLIGINFALDWMSEDDFEPEAVKTTHAIAKKSSARMKELSEGLLEFAVIEKQAMKTLPTDLNDVVNDVKDLLFKQVTETIATITFDPLPTIHCDRNAIMRVFMNLISNSIKFKKPGVSPVIHISSQVEANRDIIVSVSDNGLGIDTKYAERVFQPLERLHSRDEIDGAGLGLAICERIIKLHGGTIRIDLSYVAGTRFDIAFPSFALVP